MDDLSKDQLEQLLDILGNIFTSKEKLGKFLRTKLNIKLNRITTGDNMDDILFTLLEFFESEGQLDEFIAAIENEYPKNRRLQQMCQQFCSLQAADQSSIQTNTHLQVPKNIYPPISQTIEEVSTIAKSFRNSSEAPQQPASQIIALSKFSQQHMSHQPSPFSTNFRCQ